MAESKQTAAERVALEKVTGMLLSDKNWELVFPARKDSDSAKRALHFIQTSNSVRKKNGNPEFPLEPHNSYELGYCRLNEKEREILFTLLGNGSEFEGYKKAIVSGQAGSDKCIVIIDDNTFTQTVERLQKERVIGR